jgi:uncharacterized protein YdcH (DUF465 family)
MTPLDPVREELLRTDETFHSLYSEHQESKHRLDELRGKSLPSEEDEAEMKRLKLHKLTLKDRMEEIVRQYGRAHSHGLAAAS